MDELIKWLVDHFQGEVASVIQAPGLFLIAVLVVGAILYFVVKGYFSERLETHAARIAFLGEQLAEYKSKLSGATPDQAARELTSLRGDLTAARAQLDMITQWWVHQTTERHLTDEQKRTLKQNLENAIAGKPEMFSNVITGSIAEPEAQQYAIEILGVLQSVGLCSGQREPQHSWTNTPDERGLLLVVADENNPPPPAIAIHKALTTAGIECRFDTASTGTQTDGCMLGVAHKPAKAS